MRELSPLHKERLAYQPKLAGVLKNGIENIAIKALGATSAVKDADDIKALFGKIYGKPTVEFEASKGKGEKIRKNVGVILSGGQAPGGHNVIAGLYDALKQANPENELYGFLGGPSGITDGDYLKITDEIMDRYRNTGGFDIIGSGRTKLESEEQFKKVHNVCENLNINAIIIIGGDDSNTNACMLAQWLDEINTGIQVIGCPKTIDGDLKNEQIEAPFGFDTATKTYSELVGNISRDANSAKKYYHFIKLMGRSATHVGLEVALQTQPNITLISEEVEEKKQSLDSIVSYIANIVAERAKRGKNFGVVLVPEGLIEFIPEMKSMISSLNDILSVVEDNVDYMNAKTSEEKWTIIESKMEMADASVFHALPGMIKAQLLMDRDPHGNVQVSKIETEKLLIEMTREKLEKMREQGLYSGKFADQAHFFGYEGRCAMPTNFDSDYCYSLGYNAFALIQAGLTGYMSCVRNLTKPASEWIAGGVPLTMMMNMEKRHGKFKPVIQKALVELDGPAFKMLEKMREIWALEDRYVFPGAIQYFGPPSVCDAPTITLQLEQGLGATSVKA